MPYPVSNMIEGRGIPVSVKKSDHISKAFSIMLEKDFSQLPVLDDQDQILGVITYKNILRALKYYKADLEDLVVENAIESIDKFDLEDDIFDILPSLQANNAVLITSMGDHLIGIVTNFDTTEYFRKRSEDLMIIEEIELNIRDLIQFTFENEDGILDNDNLQKSINRITDHIDDLKNDYRSALYVYMNFSAEETKRIDDEAFENSFSKIYKGATPKSFDDLTLNELIEVLLAEERWGFYQDAFKLAKNHLRNLLFDVRNTRNHLAHFKGEISSEQRDKLIFCKETLDKVNQNYIKQERQEKAGETISDEIIEDEEIIAPVGEETTTTSSKYAPLGEYLQAIPGKWDKIRLSFQEIEEIIDDQLPPSAYTHRVWWANDSVGHVQSKHWLEAGWKVGHRNISGKEVSFVRIKEREKAYIDFFGPLKTRLNEELNIKLRETAATGINWITLIGIPETGIMAQIAICFASQSRYRIELYIDTGNIDINKIIFDELYAQKEKIEEKIGKPLGWERLEDKRASRIALYNSGSIDDDKQKLEELQEWTAKMLPIFYEATVPEINQALKKHKSKV